MVHNEMVYIMTVGRCSCHVRCTFVLQRRQRLRSGGCSRARETSATTVYGVPLCYRDDRGSDRRGAAGRGRPRLRLLGDEYRGARGGATPHTRRHLHRTPDVHHRRQLTTASVRSTGGRVTNGRTILRRRRRRALNVIRWGVRVFLRKSS